MGKRTGRPRGAPKGNRNRWVHGRYSARMRIRKPWIDAIIAECDRLVAWADQVHAARLVAAATAKWSYRVNKYNNDAARAFVIAIRSQQQRFPAGFCGKNLHRPQDRLQMGEMPEVLVRLLFFPGRKYNAYQPQEMRRQRQLHLRLPDGRDL
jgi:hypothetical protein